MLNKVSIKQHDIRDCGAACLLSIIKYYNGNISLEKIKIDTCIDKKGISAYNLILASKKYGFDSHGIKITFDELLSNRIVLPCIAYLELSNGLRHYVVIYKICKNYILIMDPAKGLKKVKLDIFKNNFKNVIIELCPISKIVNYSQDNKLINIFLNFLKEDKKLIISLLLTSIIFTILSILSSFYMKSILNSIDNNIKSLTLFIILTFTIITLLKIFLSYIKGHYETYLNKNIDIKLLPSFISHIFNLPLNAISNRTTGEITTRVNEINNIKEIFSNMFITLVLNLLLALTSCFVLMAISQKLTIVLLVLICIYLINNILWIKPINNLVEDNISLETNFNSTLTNNLAHIISIKNNGNYLNNKLEENLISYLENSFKFQNKINIYNFINNFIVEIGLFVLNTLGFILIMNNLLELIDLITYNSLYLYFIDPIKEIINLIPKYVYIKRSFIKINDFLMLEEEEKESNKESFSNGNIFFNNINFSYNMYDFPIKNYSLNIIKGNKVLVMGPSGTGKSTLFKLLFRLYEPISGTISINNINILDYNLETIRKNIAYVSQDESIYNDTIYNNIVLGNDVFLDKLNKVLEICQVNEILDKKKLRLNTFIMEDASNLSGGEKARIILARNLLKDSSILIFDETFSAISEKDANKIINDIFTEYKDKTIILISHFKPKYKFDQEIVGDFND
ncbi:MAG: ATP-binding cassette domain-containing protein [Bacilli bacterium]|nr:ATP-binding cassette domain-containing protein [Bacilli bacterium]